MERRLETLIVGNSFKKSMYDSNLRLELEKLGAEVNVIGFPEDLKGYTLDNWNDHICEEIAKTGRQTNLTGWSMGADQAIRIAAEGNELVARVTAISPMPGHGDIPSVISATMTSLKNLGSAYRLAFRKNEGGVFTFPEKEKDAFLYSNVGAELRSELETHSRDSGEEICRQTFLWMAYLQNNQHKIKGGSTIPIQYLIGDNDPLIKIGSVERLAEKHKYDGKAGEVHLLVDRHHGGPYEDGKEEVAKIVYTFRKAA